MSTLILWRDRLRITEEAKLATRRRILEAARGLFQSRGFEQSTTRDIANEAGIAAGTLFNYFATKEAIAMTMIAESLERAREEFQKQRRPSASLEEDLFAFAATGIRKLKRHRKYLQPVLETALSPASQMADEEPAQGIRVNQLESVARLVVEHKRPPPTAMALRLFWTLYAGVLAFWAADNSPQQEDTLATLDQSLSMYVQWLEDDEKPERDPA